MKLCPTCVLSMYISKIAGNKTAFQRFPPKIGKYRWPPPKHVCDNKSAEGHPITIIVVSISMFLRSRNPIDHVKRLNIHINGEILIKCS